ncbi:MAG: hypothetical protein CMJ32_02545 [Phycisphaerae bacterium]|nr:hypothetical protein [Phycisphaerae bacterium]
MPFRFDRSIIKYRTRNESWARAKCCTPTSNNRATTGLILVGLGDVLLGTPRRWFFQRQEPTMAL